MLRRFAVILPMLLVAGCSSTGELKNPFVKEKPFVPSAVPVDFAIVVDENHDTYYARQHIQQVITAVDATSRTTYTTFRDYNDSVSSRFSQETALTPSQVQEMWNEVSRYNLLQRSTPWINWQSDADIFKRNVYTVQIRANGQTRTYRQTNGFSGAVRPVMMDIASVRLPIGQEVTTPVVTPTTAAASQPALPVELPTATMPGMPAATQQ